MLSLVGQFDQFLEGKTIVFKGVFSALWHVIRQVGARYAGKLLQVVIHQGSGLASSHILPPRLPDDATCSAHQRGPRENRFHI